jgi:hypothetical protein
VTRYDRVMRSLVPGVAVAALAATLLSAQQFEPAPGAELLHRPLDQILDVNVRDGLVYYRALKSERGRLDRYVSSLNVTPAVYQGWSKPQQMAFWVNAYNAFVLATVVNHYPLQGTIKQIPGAFDKTTWRAAGKTVTLDQIEKTILPEFKEPRLYLALGRGAVGGGRLRSEAYTGERLERQLADLQREFVDNRHLYRLDRLANTLSVTPIVSWRETEFAAAYADKADAVFAQRSPLERAVVALVTPHLLASEKEFIRQNAWKMAFLEMDWRLNDLTGGRVE